VCPPPPPLNKPTSAAGRPRLRTAKHRSSRLSTSVVMLAEFAAYNKPEIGPQNWPHIPVGDSGAGEQRHCPWPASAAAPCGSGSMAAPRAVVHSPPDCDAPPSGLNVMGQTGATRRVVGPELGKHGPVVVRRVYSFALCDIQSSRRARFDGAGEAITQAAS
jgi:hypothetical protein